MRRNFAPFGRAVDYEDDVSNLRGFKGDSGDAGFLDKVCDLDQSKEIEAAADAAEFADFSRKAAAGYQSNLRLLRV